MRNNDFLPDICTIIWIEIWITQGEIAFSSEFCNLFLLPKEISNWQGVDLN